MRFYEISYFFIIYKMINFLLAIICYSVFIRIYRWYISFNKFIGEDLYQYNKKQRSKNSFVYSYCKFKNIPNHTQNVINEATEYYNNYMSLYNIQEPIVTKRENFEKVSFFEFVDNCKDNSICIIYYDDNTIISKFDHIYLGASFFQDFGKILYRAECDYIRYPPDFPILDISVARFGLKYLYEKIRGPDENYVPIRKSNTTLRRHFYTLNTPSLKKKGIVTNICIIYRIFQNILTRTNRTELKAYLTYGFKNTEYICNNIGIVFVDFTKDMSLSDFNDYILSNKYQIVATNYFMQIVDKGKEARNSVDVVLSLGYFKSHIGDNIEDFGCTFGSIPDYAIYCCSSSINNKTYVCITLNTDEYIM